MRGRDEVIDGFVDGVELLLVELREQLAQVVGAQLLEPVEQLPDRRASGKRGRCAGRARPRGAGQDRPRPGARRATTGCDREMPSCGARSDMRALAADVRAASAPSSGPSDRCESGNSGVRAAESIVDQLACSRRATRSISRVDCSASWSSDRWMQSNSLITTEVYTKN